MKFNFVNISLLQAAPRWPLAASPTWSSCAASRSWRWPTARGAAGSSSPTSGTTCHPPSSLSESSSSSFLSTPLHQWKEFTQSQYNHNSDYWTLMIFLEWVLIIIIISIKWVRIIDMRKGSQWRMISAEMLIKFSDWTKKIGLSVNCAKFCPRFLGKEWSQVAKVNKTTENIYSK